MEIDLGFCEKRINEQEVYIKQLEYNLSIGKYTLFRFIELKESAENVQRYFTLKAEEIINKHFNNVL